MSALSMLLYYPFLRPHSHPRTSEKAEKKNIWRERATESAIVMDQVGYLKAFITSSTEQCNGLVCLLWMKPRISYKTAKAVAPRISNPIAKGGAEGHQVSSLNKLPRNLSECRTQDSNCWSVS